VREKVTIGLVGDYDPSVPAHQAIPLALKRAADAARIEVNFEWVPTVEITSVERISVFDGIWCVPAPTLRTAP
jgi:CTP synthase (UTP-ammonia lyase)